MKKTKAMPGQVGTVWWVETKIEFESITDPDWVDRMAMLGIKCPGSLYTVAPGYQEDPDPDFDCKEIALGHCGDRVDIDLLDYPHGGPIAQPARILSAFKRSFIELIRHELPPHVIGRCYLIYNDDSRDLIDDYVTCYIMPDYRVTFRGEVGVKYHVCDTCGHAFTAMSYDSKLSGGTEPRLYVLQREMSKYGANMAGSSDAILLTRRLMDSINWAQFPDANLIEYPVLKSPLDGIVLPCDEA